MEIFSIMALSLRRTHRFILLLAVAMAGHGLARAEPSGSDPSAQREAAEHDKRAFEAAQRGDAETARKEFLASYAALATPKTLWNLLVVEMDANHPLDALKHLRSYLADPNADAKRRERGKGLLGELTARVGHLRIRAPEGALVNVDGNAVSNDDRKEAVDVLAGKHTVEITFQGKTQRDDVVAPAGKETTISFTARGRESAVAAPETTPKSAVAPAPPMATWILGGVAVAALGAGVAFSLDARSKKNEVDGDANACADVNSPECGHIRDVNDAGKRSATLGWIAYGGAGAALVAGGFIWALSPKKTSARAKTEVTPLVGPGIAGLRLQKTF